MHAETRYAKSGDVRIAYQVVGEGPLDLVFVPGFVSNLEHYWDDANLAHFLTRLSGFSRVILFDKRGTGLSDRPGNIPTLEERMDDVRAVMDAVGSERAAIFGISEGGAMSILFAATYPERCLALGLYGTYAHYFSSVMPPERFEAFLARIDETWGTGASLEAFAPTRVADERFRQWWARFERVSASPSAVLSLMRMNSEIDVRHVLPTVRVPALVLHRVDDTRVDIEGGRYLAAHIPGAQMAELPGKDHLLWAGDVDPVADALATFLTGSPVEIEPDRVLSTVMFTDIVGSTAASSAMGDRKWREVLDRHNGLVREEIARFRGHEVKTLGDGFLATFDGPARAVRCTAAIVEAARSLGLELRGGVHTGEIAVAGDDISGIAVNIAARVAGAAEPGQVLVSSTVNDLVAGSNLRFVDAGTRALKGIAGEIRLFSVV